MRRFCAVLSAVLLPAAMAIAGSGAAYAHPLPTRQAVDLGALRAPYGVNDRDEVAGSSTAADGRIHPFLWRAGAMIDLGDPPNGPEGVARDINEWGQVVGTALNGGGFRWDGTGMTDLAGPGFSVYSADAINNRGQIVGSFFPPEGGRSHGYLWQQGRLSDLGPIDPVDINDRGQILAGRSVEGYGYRACIWLRGRITDLAFDSPVAINNLGWVTGTATSPDYSVRAVLWRAGTTTQLGTLGGTSDRPTSINDRGQILGTSETADAYRHAVIWQNGRTIDLAIQGIVLQTIPQQATAGQVFDINDLGHFTVDLAQPPDFAGPDVLYR